MEQEHNYGFPIIWVLRGIITKDVQDTYYHVLKSNSPFFLLNKKLNVDKKEINSEMENFARTFREMSFVL